MNYPNRFARLRAAVVVLVAPLSLLGAINDDIARQLKLTKYVSPEFPSMSRLEGMAEGQVALAISRTPAGVPSDVLVLEATDAQFAAAAVEAAREWRFQPTSDPAELATRTVRIGFKLGGIVVYPLGKKHLAEVMPAVDETKLREPIRVPHLQSLAQAPKALAQPMPAYPAALQARPIEGKAAVRFYVDEDGRVRMPEVVEATTPEFADAALTAVAQWRYEPPQHGARNIVVRDSWSFQFKATN